jgi:hypothetical protein
VKRTVVLRLVLFHPSQSLPKRWRSLNCTFPAQTVLFMDEGRFGRISERADCWAPRPVRPRISRQVVRESLYAFAAIEPLRGALAWNRWPK